MILLGCGKERIIGPELPPAPFVYPDRSTPEHALLYMAAAFERRDSVRTDSVYADDYEGTSVDMTEPFPATFTFHKSDEVGIVGEMALSNSIIYIRVDFGPQNTWSRVQYASDPPEWVTLQIPHFIIDVNDAVLGEFRTSAPSPGVSQIFEFSLRPTFPNGPSGTPVWEIVRWVESRSET